MDTGERFSKLFDLLVQQDDVITGLIAAGEEQTECLRKNDARGLQPIVQRQQALAARLKALEEERLQVQRSLETALIFSREASLLDLAACAGGWYGEKLRKMRTLLLEKTNRLKEINELNRLLTRQALRFTGFMIDTLNPQRPAYTSSGEKKEISRRQPALDRTV